MTYPINDHRPAGPQPEYCELCGMPWPGADMLYADVEGLRGVLICGSKQTGCAHFRQAVSYKDRWRRRRKYGRVGTGKHPVYPPGAPDLLASVEAEAYVEEDYVEPDYTEGTD